MPFGIQKIARLIRHRWAEGKLPRVFPPAVLQQLEQAIAASERQHTGQIRFCIEGGLPLSYIRRAASTRERAVRLFGKLGVWDTEKNNGVLIYLLLADHAIEIVADRGLARAVPPSTWQTLVQDMGLSFERAAFAQGLETALARVSDLLVTHSPIDASQSVDKADELPNVPVVQTRFSKD